MLKGSGKDMNLNKKTINDCLDMFITDGSRVILDNGRVTGFIKKGEQQKMQEIKKTEAEERLNASITDSMFEEALIYAKRKQAYIYQHERREVVMQRWYLLELVKEYVRNLVFSRFTMDLCREVCNVEKERPQKQQALTKDSHIVASPTKKIKQ